MEKIPVVFDMETQDPDDYLTLILLLGHPQVKLKAVTITPGSSYQVGIVRRALDCFGVQLPVGAYNINHSKKCVSPWHYRAYGTVQPSYNARPGYEVLAENCDKDTILITGAPLKNIGMAIKNTSFVVKSLFAQGGFAGEGVVPRHLQIKKFNGKRMCATFNLSSDPESALLALEYSGFPHRYFVSKNVCHRVLYDVNMHNHIDKIRKKSNSLEVIWQGMNKYLYKNNKRSGKSKKLHDPLAACCAIDSTIGSWVEVELFTEKGLWGARLSPGSNTKIIIDYDHNKFIDTFSKC
ncbi:nucleoside hydrolase [Candidatus Uabimicrobium sp. HlEnr_7]|uniref:nucleoside hydrolase n=1 Tax=Candidatus Uabimicrobium helgolandensis TaxID=3095367 RepID=UPI0035579CD3